MEPGLTTAREKHLVNEMKSMMGKEYEQTMDFAKGRYQLDFWDGNLWGEESHLKRQPEPYDILSWYGDLGCLQNVEPMIQEALVKLDSVHYSLVHWETMKEEIAKGTHPHQPKKNGTCRNPGCNMKYRDDVYEFLVYCCKQCATRCR